MAQKTQDRVNRQFNPDAELGLSRVTLMSMLRYNRAKRHKADYHDHPGILEICYVVSGKVEVEIAGETFRALGGEMLVSFPGERHGYPSLEDKSYRYYLQIDLKKTRRPLLNLNAKDSRKLIDSLLALPRRYFRGNPDIKYHFNKCFETRSWKEPQLKALSISSHIQDILIHTLRCSREEIQNRESDQAEAFKAHIEANLKKNLSLDEIADHFGMSTSHFKSRFKSLTGFSPRDYILRAKVERSKSLLEKMSVTDVAHDLGFSSSQYFASVFKRFVEKSPSEYRT